MDLRHTTGEDEEEVEKTKSDAGFDILRGTGYSSRSPDGDSDETACEIRDEIEVPLKVLVISLVVEIFLQPKPRLYMSLLDLHDYSKSLLLSSTPATSPSSLVFDQNLTINEMGGYFMRLLRGFISFTVHHKARIYNPTTRQLLFVLLGTITVISVQMQKIRSESWVFVLEAGGSWKRVAKELHPHIPSQLELTMNGVLY
ncbi:unnamed protein product [Thlaspi arvense]|uniref:Uncharacterized protein n=1 Tax=Thlaspi arvense TaxID=13288 RepID=A0AAU9SQR8_THLAR|nr:unnamed protein product [Thlaspi arvense]